MIVVDASVLATGLIDEGDDGDRVRARLVGETILAPEIIDLEVASVVRRLRLAGSLSERRARFAIDDLEAMPFVRAPHRPLLRRSWELRSNLSVYDAAYVVLAELLAAPLLTADARLARVRGAQCDIEVIAGAATK